MRALVLIALAIGAVCGPASAQINPGDQTDRRFDLPALQGICSRIRARDNRAEDQVLRAAGVVLGEPDDRSNERVGALFAAHMPLCDGFNLSRGSVLKYAVAARTYDFLFTAANIWEVDLNVVDAGDGRNLLDYVETEIWRNEGKPAEAELVGFRDMLLRAGARTTAQLEAGEDCRPSTRCRQ